MKVVLLTQAGLYIYSYLISSGRSQITIVCWDLFVLARLTHTITQHIFNTSSFINESLLLLMDSYYQMQGPFLLPSANCFPKLWHGLLWQMGWWSLRSAVLSLFFFFYYFSNSEFPYRELVWSRMAFISTPVRWNLQIPHRQKEKYSPQ